MRTRTIVLFFLSALVLLGIGPFCTGEKEQQPPNIILISVDTWRGDYFTPERMPALYDYASKNCKIFTNAHSNSTWTKPSHLTMLTGLLQSEHGVEYQDSMIPPTLPMVQNKLQDAGYTTAAFVGGGFVSQGWGFERGFDKFWELPGLAPNSEARENLTIGQKYRRNMEMFDKAEQYLASNPEQPVFLFLHTYLIHEYWNLSFPKDRIVKEVGNELRKDKRFAEVDRPILGKFMNDASPEERHELYAQAVRDCDKQLTQFLTALERSPLFSNAKVIITSDHGEGLGDIHEEHIDILHAESPYLEQTHVPIIVYGLGVGKTDQLVGVDDIAGTILKFAGVEENPQKSLLHKRDFVLSEDVLLDRKDPHRSMAVISKTERFLLTRDGNIRLFRDADDHNDLIDSHASPFVGWAAIEGLYDAEGPYPQWSLPVVRWAHGPRTILKFSGDGKPAWLILGFRRNENTDQTMKIALNGEPIDEFELGTDYRFRPLLIPLQTREGENTLVFEYSRMEGDRELTVCFKRIMVVSKDEQQRLPDEVRCWHALQFPFTGWDKASGLGPESGPFPQWDLPVIRWGLGPRTELDFESSGEPLALSMVCGPQQVKGQEITILLNGEEIFRKKFDVPYGFDEIDIPLDPKVGTNRLTFEYVTWETTDPEYQIALIFKRLRIVPPEFSILGDNADEET